MVFFPYKQIIINPKRPSIINAPQYKGNVDPVSRININLGPSCVSNNSNIDTQISSYKATKNLSNIAG